MENIEFSKFNLTSSLSITTVFIVSLLLGTLFSFFLIIFLIKKNKNISLRWIKYINNYIVFILLMLTISLVILLMISSHYAGLPIGIIISLVLNVVFIFLYFYFIYCYKKVLIPITVYLFLLWKSNLIIDLNVSSLLGFFFFIIDILTVYLLIVSRKEGNFKILKDFFFIVRKNPYHLYSIILNYLKKSKYKLLSLFFICLVIRSLVCYNMGISGFYNIYIYLFVIFRSILPSVCIYAIFSELLLCLKSNTIKTFSFNRLINNIKSSLNINLILLLFLLLVSFNLRDWILPKIHKLMDSKSTNCSNNINSTNKINSTINFNDIKNIIDYSPTEDNRSVVPYTGQNPQGNNSIVPYTGQNTQSGSVSRANPQNLGVIFPRLNALATTNNSSSSTSSSSSTNIQPTSLKDSYPASVREMSLEDHNAVVRELWSVNSIIHNASILHRYSLIDGKVVDLYYRDYLSKYESFFNLNYFENTSTSEKLEYLNYWGGCLVNCNMELDLNNDGNDLTGCYRYLERVTIIWWTDYRLIKAEETMKETMSILYWLVDNRSILEQSLHSKGNLKVNAVNNVEKFLELEYIWLKAKEKGISGTKYISRVKVIDLINYALDDTNHFFYKKREEVLRLANILKQLKINKLNEIGKPNHTINLKDLEEFSEFNDKYDQKMFVEIKLILIKSNSEMRDPILNKTWNKVFSVDKTIKIIEEYANQKVF